MIKDNDGIDVATTDDIRKFRYKRPIGKEVMVPAEQFFDDAGRKINGYRIKKARVLESHPRVAVTTSGTFTWAQIFYAEKGIIY